MDKTLRNVLIGSIIIVTFSIAYYFVIFIPRIELQKQKKASEEIEIRKKCNADAEKYAVQDLKDKSEMSDSNLYDDAVTKGFYLKDDFNMHYEQCLSINGLEK